ncbi:MAG: PQQ-binding-like beta-propeller repeat protein, partial [Hyphomonadaceae bacterium]
RVGPPETFGITEMTNNRVSVLIAMVIVSLAFAGSVWAGDWPHWRGPYQNGSSDEKNLPATWSETENVAWRVSLPGHSSATPVIANGKVFVSSTDRESDALLALCFDSRNGEELWRRKLGASSRQVPRNNMGTPSPVTDSKRVYFMFGSGELAGLDHKGKSLWSRNLDSQYGNISMKYGYSSSPLLYGNKLYILMQRRNRTYRAPDSSNLDAFILAVDANTGKNIWKQPRVTDAQDESLDSYSSPLLYKNNGRDEILVIGADYVTATDPATGQEFWRYGYARQKSPRWRNISSPGLGRGLIYGVRPKGGNGLFVLRSGGEGNLGDDHVAWEFNGPTPDVCTPLYYKGSLYVLDGKSGGVLTCLDALTGRQKWQGKLGSRTPPWRASLTAADDKLYCISEGAEAVVLAAGGNEFRILSRIEMEDRPVQASIAIADGRLFIRTANILHCIAK